FLLLFAVTACITAPIIRFGFDTGFKKNVTGLTIMHIGNNALAVNLNGESSLNEGAVLVELINSTGDIVFTKRIIKAGNYMIDESFPAVSGNWKLKYKSLEGTGLLKLHLTAAYGNY